MVTWAVSVRSRLTRNTAARPSSTVAMTGASPWRAVSYAGAWITGRITAPDASRLVIENGKKVACRQAGPPGSVMIGAITLTSWAGDAGGARDAEVTRSLRRRSVISRLPTTTASATV